MVSPRMCFICLSPYRKEVLALRAQGVPYLRIWKKYATLMNYPSSDQAFGILIAKHIRLAHKPQGSILLPQLKREGQTPVNIENFAQKMLELGVAKIEGMTPEQVQLKDVVAANKLLLESKKLKLNESEFQLTMAKLFAPPIIAIEGETLEP